jgi:hypothetical protein
VANRLLGFALTAALTQIIKHSNGDAWIEAQGKPYSPQQIGAVSGTEFHVAQICRAKAKMHPFAPYSLSYKR